MTRMLTMACGQPRRLLEAETATTQASSKNGGTTESFRVETVTDRLKPRRARRRGGKRRLDYANRAGAVRLAILTFASRITLEKSVSPS